MSNSFQLPTSHIVDGLYHIQKNNKNILDSSYSFPNEIPLIGKTGKSPVHYPRSSFSHINSERMSQTLGQSAVNNSPISELPPLETYEEVIFIFNILHTFIILF